MELLKRIETGTPEGDSLGFTDDLFSGWLEIDERMKRLYLHYVISKKKNQGNTQNLLVSWLEAGYEVRVVMPREIMRHILMKPRLQELGGFYYTHEFFPKQYAEPVLIAASQPKGKFPFERHCFCPYTDGPQICGSSRYLRRKYYCEQRHKEGRNDCPIIKTRGDF